MKVLGHAVLGCVLPAIYIAPVLASGRVLLRYLDIGEQGAAEVFATDKTGNLYTVAAVTNPSGRSPLRVIKTDANGSPLATFDINVNLAAPNVSQTAAYAAATDTQGNLVIVGAAGPPGFPLVSPLFPSVTGNGAFVMKLDSQLHGIIFSTVLSHGSIANAVAIDAAGNIYVAGGTDSPNFPITPGAYQTKPPGTNAQYLGPNSYAFLSEISPNGDRLLYSTYFGGDSVYCPFNPGACIGKSAGTSASALAIAPSSAILMAGASTALDLPTTPGTLAGCGGTSDSAAAFIAEFAPAGARLEWSTCLNPTGRSSDYQVSVQINAVASDSAGNVVVAGSAPRGAFPTTPGVVQPTVPEDPEFPGFIQWAGFIAKLNSTGANLLWSTYFGGSFAQGVTALAVDPFGTVAVTGYSNPNSLPAAPNVPLLGDSFAARLSGDGRSLQNLYVGPNGSSGMGLVLSPAGTFVAAGQGGSLWIESAGSGPSLLGISNAAIGPVLGLVSASELVSLYGIDIGPQTAITGQLVDGAFTSSLGGYQVLFDGIAAPLLYVGPTQINTIVPHEVAGQDYTHLQIAGPSATIDGPTLALRPAEPQIFRNSQTGLAAALNQDGSINSPQKPAKPGSIVSIFTTGNGPGAGSDGQVLTQANLGNSLPVAILDGTTSLEVLYADNAPGLVAGVFQINFRLPKSLPPEKTYEFQLQVDGAMSRFAAVAVTH
jgi:uncharacterized protein (TIGR03437 family)